MNRFRKFVTNRWLLASLGAVLVYTLAGFLLVPFLVRQYTPKLAAELLKRQASVGLVRFNPFLLTFEAQDLALNEADGQPVMGLKRLFLDFEPGEYLDQRALVFSELSLENPSLNLIVEADGKTNLARIAESLPKSEESPPPSSESPPAIVLRHFGLSDGTVKFTDRATTPPLGVTVEQLHFELADLATLPERTGNYTIAAGIPGGGRLAWKGDLSLNPIASSGEWRIDALRLATVWQFIQDRLNLTEPGGEIGLSARYRFAHSKDKTDLTISDGTFHLNGLKLGLANAREPLLNLEEIGFDQASVDLAGQTVKIPSVYVRKGRLAATLDANGELDWSQLAKPVKAASSAPVVTTATPAPAQTPGSPWKLAVESFEIATVGFQFADASRKTPLLVSVGDFGLKLAAEAEVGVEQPRAHVDNLDFHIDHADLSQAGRRQALFGWDSFRLQGGQMDLEKKEISIQRATVVGGGAAIVRQADGSVHPLELFAAEGSEAPPPPSGHGPKRPDQTEPAWKFMLDEFVLQGFRLGFKDQTWWPELAYNLDNIQVSAKHISNDGKSPVSFDTRLQVRQGGTLQVSGTALPNGDSAKARIRLDRFDLKPLQALLSRFAVLNLESAEVSTDLSVDFRQADPKPSVKATGGVNIHALSLKESKGNKRFLSWKNLAVNGIDLSLGPDRLKVKEVRIVEPDAVLAIFKDKSTNIGAVMKPQKPAPKTAKTSPKPAVKVSTNRPAAEEQPFPVDIGRVVVEKGKIDFSDMSLILPFATHIDDFGGAVAGFSLTPTDRATMKFEGRVDQYGEVKVDASLSPLDIKTFADIQVVFRNVAMNTLSPYSATFAGRKIESGKLNLDLDYKIEKSRLKSENKIVLENFTLGSAVESPGSTSLPLDLAVALLTDSEGKIKAAVPIEGNVDDPQFAYGKLVWDAFVTLITKAVTAPFNAIASMLGGSQEKLDAVLFDAGRDVIAAPEREKLRKVAEAMAQRSKLKLAVHGRFDPKADGEALKSFAVRRAMAQRLEVTLAPGEEPDAVAFNNATAQRELEKLAAERGGSRVLDTLQVAYLKESGKLPQRVGMLAGLTGKASETPDFYERIFKYLVDQTQLPQAELAGIAERRGQAVMKELAATGRIDRARLTFGQTESTDQSEAGKVPTRLELKAQ